MCSPAEPGASLRVRPQGFPQDFFPSPMTIASSTDSITSTLAALDAGDRRLRLADTL